MATKSHIKYLKKQQQRKNEYLERKKKAYLTKNIKEYPVNKECELLEFLYQVLKEQSKNNVKNILTKRYVAVNGLPVTQYNYILYRGDIVQIAKEQLPKVKSETNKHQMISKLNIIYEDDDFIVINKPNGLLTIESDNEKLATAYKTVLEYMAEKDIHARCFQVHRLDKETSGILLFTKKYELKEKLTKRWNSLVLERGYTAIVDGHMPKAKDTIISYLKESSTTLMYDSHNELDGLKSITHYQVIKSNAKYSLLNVLIDTGRKNQIRVAMNDLGHPIIGDDKYGTPTNPIKRLGLHASSLVIKHPENGKVLKFKANIPHEFNRLFSIERQIK